MLSNINKFGVLGHFGGTLAARPDSDDFNVVENNQFLISFPGLGISCLNH